MKRQFVISVNDDSPTTAKKMVEWLQKQPLQWSHYMKGFWQLIDHSGEMTPKQIREGISATLPDVHVIVFQIPTGGTWQGWVPTKMADWISENWE